MKIQRALFFIKFGMWGSMSVRCAWTLDTALLGEGGREKGCGCCVLCDDRRPRLSGRVSLLCAMCSSCGRVYVYMGSAALLQLLLLLLLLPGAWG